MTWNTQYWIVQHDNVIDPVWIVADKDGRRTVCNVNVWGPYNAKKHAEEFADTLAYNNQGWSFVVCETDCAFQSMSTVVKRKIEAAA